MPQPARRGWPEPGRKTLKITSYLAIDRFAWSLRRERLPQHKMPDTAPIAATYDRVAMRCTDRRQLQEARMPTENRLRETRKSLPEIWLVLIRLKLARWTHAWQRRRQAGSCELFHSRSSLNRPLKPAHGCVARGIWPRKLALNFLLDSNLAPRAEH